MLQFHIVRAMLAFRLHLEVLGVVLAEEGVVEIAVVDVSLVLVGLHGVDVVDVDVFEVHVGHNKFVLIDLTIEGITEWHVIEVARAGANAARVGVVKARELLVLGGCVVWHDHEEHLHWHTLLPAHGQD